MLEQKIDELNKALAASTEAALRVTAVWEQLLAQAKVVQERVADGAPQVLAAGVPVIETSTVPQEAKPATKATKAKTAAPVEPTEPADEGVTLEQLQEIVKAKAPTHRADVVAVLKTLGVGRVSEIPAAKYAKALAALQAIGSEELV